MTETPVSLSDSARSYAGFWLRLLGSVFDGIIVGFPLAIVLVLVHVDYSSTLSSIILSAVSICYGTYMIGRAEGQTYGQEIVGVRTVSLDHGGSIGFRRAFARELVSILSAFLIVGYLWMLWDPRKQTWHDRAVGSCVVVADDPPSRSTERVPPPPTPEI